MMQRIHSTTRARHLMMAFAIGLIVLSIMVMGASQASAQGITGQGGFTAAAVPQATEDGQCMVDRYNLLQNPGQDVTDLNCTSNDVWLANVTTIPQSCILGEEFQVTVSGEFQSNATNRYDVGVFISQYGGTPNAPGGLCYSDYLSTTNSSGWVSYEPGDPGDICGDINSGEIKTWTSTEFTLLCQDTDNDNFADFNACTVWANSESSGTANKPSCTSEDDISADSSPKCTCQTIEFPNVVVYEAEITVYKVTQYPDGTSFPAPTAFKFDISPAATADPDFFYLKGGEHNTFKVDPGTYEVAETSPFVNQDGDWQLTNITCTQDGVTVGTWDGYAVEDVSVSGLTVASGDLIECTFTNQGTPTAVSIASFTAAAAPEGVTLAWETVSETGNAGFNVYRSESDAGTWTKVNAVLIPAKAPGSPEGQAYTWTDASAEAGMTYFYQLEDVALSGATTRHDPVSVALMGPNAVGLAGFGAAATSGPALAGLAGIALAALAGAGLRRRR